MDLETKNAAADFLYREARLLDTRDFTGWLNLFAEDGRYWLPLSPEQTDPLGMASIMYEDRAVLEMRIERLMHPRAYATDPPPRTTHLVGNVVVVDTDPESVTVQSVVLMTEFRPEASPAEGPRIYSGAVRHTLQRTSDGFTILEKRVDLDNAVGVHGVITVPI